MENTNYFGRICRFLGRITLFAGFILGIGICALLVINPFISEDGSSMISDITDTTTQTTPSSAGASSSFVAAISQNQIVSWFITGAIITAAIIAVCYLAKKYNAVIRAVIANIAKGLKSPIHMVELGLTLIIWSTVLIMLIFSFPLASSILIFPYILNVLFFLFGWISYGMPDYKV